MIADWDALQFDVRYLTLILSENGLLIHLQCEDIDNELRSITKEEPILDPVISSEPIFSYPLSSWAYDIKLQQMQWVLQLGFELEIYQPDELAGMYWYVWSN